MFDPLSPITRVAGAFVLLFVVAPALSNPHFSQTTLVALWPLIAFIAFVWVARRPLFAVIRWTAEGLFIGLGARVSGVVGRLSRQSPGQRRRILPTLPRGPQTVGSGRPRVQSGEPLVPAGLSVNTSQYGNMQIDTTQPDAISALRNLGFKPSAAKKMVIAARAQLGAEAEFNDIVIFALKMGRRA